MSYKNTVITRLLLILDCTESKCLKMTESSTISNLYAEAGVGGNSPTPQQTDRSPAQEGYEEVVVLQNPSSTQLQTESDRPPVLEGYEEVVVRENSPSAQACTPIDERPPVPLPRDRTLPISGYEEIGVASPPENVYTTVRNSASTPPKVVQRGQLYIYYIAIYTSIAYLHTLLT